MATISIEQAREDVTAIFLSYLGRAAEYQAVSYYVDNYMSILEALGDDPAAVENGFKALSAEVYATGAANGEVPSAGSTTSEEYVKWIYQNVLGREAEPEGLAYWVAELDSGNSPREALVAVILVAVDGQPEDSRDKMFYSNRLEVAQEFGKFENSNPGVLANLPYNAAQVMEGVTEDPATKEAALDKLYVATGGGQSAMLTPGVDNLVGTSGDDMFTALPVNAATGAAATTLSAFDSIDGGLGNDTLSIYAYDGQNASLPDSATIKNVETINIYNDGMFDDAFGGASGVDASRFVGATEVWQIGGSNYVTDLDEDVVAGFRNIVLADEAFFAVVAADDATSLNVEFDNVTGLPEGDVPGAGSVVTLYAEGDALTDVTVDGDLVGADEAWLDLYIENTGGAAVETLTVSTAINAFLRVTGDVGTIDASGSSGKLMYVEGESAAEGTGFIGGSADDLIVVESVTLDSSFDGGEGTDSLWIGGDGVFQTETYDAINAGLVNIEELVFLGDDVELDASQLADFTSLGFAGGGEVVLSNLAADQTVVLVDATWFVDPEAEEAGGPDSLLLESAAADVAIDVQTSKWVTIDVGAVGATGGSLTVSSADAGDLGYDNTSGKFSTIDVSGFLGDFYLAGMASNVKETLILGAGSADEIEITVDDTSSSSYGAMDVIEGFDATEDTLNGLGDVTGITLSAGVSSLQMAFSEAATASDGLDGGVVLFVYESNTYLFADTTGSGVYDNADFALQLVGTYTADDLSFVEA
ncbi:DUF4214 domain-containing protein [Verticiella sediminum]|nr:DUF4214 domain-containing protein [Verticiella sediminum]